MPQEEEVIDRAALFEALKKKFPRAELLDEYVHDAKGDEAAEINNRGLDAQLEYLAEAWSLKELKDLLDEKEP